jgi:hypothetical protein
MSATNIDDILDEVLVGVGVTHAGKILIGWPSDTEARLIAVGVDVDLLLACCADNIVQDDLDDDSEDIDRGKAIDDYKKSTHRLANK